MWYLETHHSKRKERFRCQDVGTSLSINRRRIQTAAHSVYQRLTLPKRCMFKFDQVLTSNFYFALFSILSYRSLTYSLSASESNSGSSSTSGNVSALVWPAFVFSLSRSIFQSYSADCLAESKSKSKMSDFWILTFKSMYCFRDSF